MRLIYQMSVTEDWSDDERDGFIAEAAGDDSPEGVDREYFDAVIAAVRDNIEKIDEAIARASDNWKIGRMSKVDLAVIRLAAAEMLYFPDIPHAVSINEAVDLAKRYGSGKSYEFVNGVLGKIAEGGSR